MVPQRSSRLRDWLFQGSKVDRRTRIWRAEGSSSVHTTPKGAEAWRVITRLISTGHRVTRRSQPLALVVACNGWCKLTILHSHGPGCTVRPGKEPPPVWYFTTHWLVPWATVHCSPWERTVSSAIVYNSLTSAMGQGALFALAKNRLQCDSLQFTD